MRVRFLSAGMVTAALLFITCDSGNNPQQQEPPPKDLELIYPKNDAGPFSVGQTVKVTWKASAKVSTVYFSVSTNDGATWSQSIIDGSIDAKTDGWDWKIGTEYFPVTTYPSKTCRLKILEYNNAPRNDVSGVFEVR